jgi:cellulose synthase/poly-beta-1,6-N-acetylglucosamine synthase-like glycosyltransferase
MEWARQARRWTIGAAEVFHYFMVKSRRIPFLTSLSWSITFLIYYGVLLCSSGLFSLTSFFAMMFLIQNIPIYVSYVMYSLIAVQMFSFSIAFLIDIFIPKILNIDECIFILRNVFHFLMTPFVLIGYSIVELYALHEVLIRGKKVCKHGASNKNALN